MRGQGTSFARLTQVLGAVAQSGSAPRSHRGGQGFKSPQLHREVFTFRLGLYSRFGQGLRARVSAETYLANARRNCNGVSVVWAEGGTA